MRLVIITAAAMAAFAANALLNRAALAGGLIDPAGFAAIRTASGAAALAVLALAAGRAWPRIDAGRMAAALALAVYMLGFSFAYVALDAGAGALILFGGVQAAMLAGAVALREAVPARRWLGVGLALAGLAALTRPDAGAVPEPAAAAMMALAAAGWGAYSLAGRRQSDPVAATALHFALATPLVAAALPFAPMNAQPAGVALALVSGIVTSGLGYAAWYAAVPALGAGRAAAAQLTVPAIALAGGAAFLGERPGAPALAAAAVILAGVAIAVLPYRRMGSSGS